MNSLFKITTVAAMAVAFLSSGQIAEACSCMAPDVETSWVDSSDVAIVEVTGERRRGNTLWILATVQRPFKGGIEAGEQILLSTPSSSAVCGLTGLIVSNSYLINGRRGDPVRGQEVLDVGLCGYNVPAASLTESDIGFLSNNAEPRG